MIRNATAGDAEALCDIYNYYVQRTVITFEEEPVSAAEMAERIRTVTARFPWLVYEQHGKVVGFAYASQWKERTAFRRTVEGSIYVSHSAAGRGIGTRLYEALISRLRGQGVHSVIGGIALPNPQSVKLHEKLGFEKAGHFADAGWKFEQWIDLGYWQLMLAE